MTAAAAPARAFVLTSIGAVLVVLGGGSPGVVAQAPPRFPSEANRVTVDVVIMDDKGRPVPGLTREDFVVKENGVVQSILDFEAVDVSSTASAPAPPAPAPGAEVITNVGPEMSGRSFLIVVDDLNLSPTSAELVKDAVVKFLQTHVREGDAVTLAPTAGGGWWTGRMTEGRDDLVAALKAVKGRRIPNTRQDRMSDYEAMLIETKRDREAINHVTQRYQLYGLTDQQPGQEPGEEARPPLDFGQGYSLVRANASEVYHLAKERNVRTLRNLERAMNALSAGRGRRTVLLASDGFVHDNQLPEFKRVEEAARRSNSVLYFFDARGLRGRDIGGADVPLGPDAIANPTFSAREVEYDAMSGAGAEALALDTGGFVIRNSNDLASGMGRISGESRTFYLLGYEPTDKKADGKYRKIEVEVRRRGLKVRARKGYYAEGGTREAAVAPDPFLGGETPPAAQRALDAPNAERGIPMRMTSYILGGAAGGRATVVLAAEADPAAVDFEPAAGGVKGALETFSALAARDTGEVARRERLVGLDLKPEARAQMARTWVPVLHTYELPPGKYQASLAVRDPRSGRVGSLRYDIEVPPLPGLRVTTPILTDAFQRGGEGSSAVPVPIARRSFAPGTRLVCAFGVEGARRDADGGEPRVSITYEVRRSDGTVVTRAFPVPLPLDDKGSLAGQFSLTLNRPGGYEMHIRAKDEISGDQASAVQAFVVEPS